MTGWQIVGAALLAVILAGFAVAMWRPDGGEGCFIVTVMAILVAPLLATVAVATLLLTGQLP